MIKENHHLYNEHLYTWVTIRDCMAGEDRIKFKSENYLPIPAAMLDDTTIPAPSTQAITSHPLLNNGVVPILSQYYNPNYHQIPAYAAYKSRARFPNLVSFLYRGLMGLASADSPSIQLPKELEYLEADYATKEGLTLSRLFVKTLGEILLTGRCQHVLDPESPDSDRILIVDYKAEQLTQWLMRDNSPVQVVLIETKDDTDDLRAESSDQSLYYNLLDITTGKYAIFKYNDDEQLIGTPRIPTYKGRAVDFLPITYYGANNNTIAPDPPPMAPVANTSIQIYQKDADLSQAIYLTCNPTLVLTGISDDLGVIATGPTVAFKIANPNAKVFYTTTDTSAFQFIHNHINSLYEQAIIYGAQLLDSSKKSAETAETARLRQVAAGATLKSVVTTVGHGFSRMLKQIARWKGLSESQIAQIKFSPITEFGSALTPQEQKQLVESWVSGAISHQTVLSNFRKAGILGEGRTEDDEFSQLAKEGSDAASRLRSVKDGVPSIGR